MDVRAIVAKILEIPDDPMSWDLILTDPEIGLALVNYTDSSNMEVYGKIKGVVIDINNQRIVCQSYEYTSMAINNLDKEIWLPDGTGYIKLTDIYGRNFFFHKDDILIRPSFPGIVIRVFKHQGKVYFSSHRKLNLENSKLSGHSELSFAEMYRQLNGPSAELLFPDGSRDSPFCYIFLVVHPDLIDVSKIPLTTGGFIVYLGVKQTRFTKTEPVSLDTSTDWTSGKLVSLTEMSVPEANLFLNWGYAKPSEQVVKFIAGLGPGDLHQLYKSANLTVSDETLTYLAPKLHDIPNPAEFLAAVKEWLLLSNEITQANDPRLHPGEAVIIYRKTPEGSWEPALRIQSIGYNWRDKIRANDINLYHRFYVLADRAKSGFKDQNSLMSFLEDFPYMGDFNEAEVSEQLSKYGHVVGWPVADTTLGTKFHYLSSYQHRLKNIWAAFFMAVPLREQIPVWGMLERYKSDKKNLVEWLFMLYRKWNGKEPVLISEPSLKLKELGICLEARNIICRSGKTGGKVKHNISKGVRMANGRALYRMVKNMESLQK